MCLPCRAENDMRHDDYPFVCERHTQARLRPTFRQVFPLQAIHVDQPFDVFQAHTIILDLDEVVFVQAFELAITMHDA